MKKVPLNEMLILASVAHAWSEFLHRKQIGGHIDVFEGTTVVMRSCANEGFSNVTSIPEGTVSCEQRVQVDHGIGSCMTVAAVSEHSEIIADSP